MRAQAVPVLLASMPRCTISEPLVLSLLRAAITRLPAPSAAVIGLLARAQAVSEVLSSMLHSAITEPLALTFVALLSLPNDAMAGLLLLPKDAVASLPIDAEASLPNDEVASFLNDTKI